MDSFAAGIRMRSTLGFLAARRLQRPTYEGLAISQNILLEHGGRIVAGDRVDGPGASFEIQIPVLR